MPGWEGLGSTDAPWVLLHPLTPNGCSRPCRLWQQPVEGKLCKTCPRELPGIPDCLLWSAFGGYMKAKPALRRSLWLPQLPPAPALGLPAPCPVPGLCWQQNHPIQSTPGPPRREKKQSTIRDVTVPLCRRWGWELILPLTGEMERLRLTKQLHKNSRRTMIEITSSLKLLSNPTHE